MNILVIFVAIIYAVNGELTVEKQWQDFKTLHQKQYATLNEENKRFAIFQQNLINIEEHNKLYKSGLSTYEQGITKFSDLTREEFIEFLKTSGPISQPKNAEKFVSTNAAPDSFDWRTKGAVTDVKDQGQCGSCWAFSTTGSIEGQLKLKKTLISLSEQSLVDCSEKYGNHGCNGGWMESAYDYIKDNGIPSEKDYPYTGRDENCKYNAKTFVTKTTGYKQANDEEAIKEMAGTLGPVAVACDASGFQNYKSGILDDHSCSSENLNHGVLIVGYGKQNGQDYWLVKNSWGKGWGENGYIRMSRNKNNQCGIGSYGFVPTV